VATIYTHGVFGLGLGRVFTGRRMPPLFWALAFLLPVVPDFDAFGTMPYGHPLGHRGFTHSLAFALGLGLVAAGLTYRYFRMRFWPLWGFFFAATASHGILDAFTNGGYGIPLFWPLSDARFGPWGPIQVADFGFEVPDWRRSRTVRTELLYVWLPTAVLVVLVTTGRYLGFRRRGGAGVSPARSKAGETPAPRGEETPAQRRSS
jgi:inner membrane protein